MAKRKLASKTPAAEVKIYIDPVANTLNLWWDDPKKAYSSEEVDSPLRNDVLIKDKQGRPISLEIIGIFPDELNVVKKLKDMLPEEKEPFLLQAIA